MGTRSKDFHIRVANRMETNPQTVKKYLDAIIDTIAYELYVNKECYVYGLGNFYMKEIPEQIYRDNVKGTGIMTKVPAHGKPQFVPADDFVNDANFCGVTQWYRRRLKNKQLSKKDIARIVKAEALEKMKNISEYDRQVAKTNFAELLQQKTEEYKERKQKELENELSTTSDSGDSEI